METVSLSEFAIILSVSEPTLRKRMAEAPEGVIIKRGTHGDAYAIDPEAGVRWWQALKAAEDQQRADRSDRIGALQLELLGRDAALADADVGGISAAEQLQALQAELAAIKLGRERAELVRADDVLATMAEFAAAVRASLEQLPIKLSRRVEVPPDVLTMLNALTALELTALADKAAGIETTYGSNSHADAHAAPDRALPPGQ